MQSTFAQIMLDLQDRIAAVVPSIRMIDRYIGQDQTAIKPALDYPAVLIDTESAEYEEAGEGCQFARAVFSVRIMYANFVKCLQKSPLAVRQKALDDFETEQRVVAAIHGWAPTALDDEAQPHQYCEPFIRTADRSENLNDIGLRIRTVLFSTAWEERVPEPVLEPEPEPEPSDDEEPQPDTDE